MRHRAFAPLIATALTAGLAACSAPAPTAPAAKPAPATAKAGPALRAIGTEPGWLAEVGPGDTPSIHLQLDYGERKLDVPRATRLEEISGYSGNSSDGVWVSLTYKREQCSDGMSDRDYAASVELQVDGQQYHGCAELLSP